MGGSSGGGMGSGLISQISSSIGNIADYHIGKRQGALAARAETAQQRRANDLYQSLYNDVQGDYSPYQQGGRNAYDALLATYGLNSGFENSQGYSDAHKAFDAAQPKQTDAQALLGNAGIFGHKKLEAQPFEQSAQYQQALAAFNQSHSGQPDYSGFENSPDYQFALQQGQKSLDRSAASHGRLYSGAQMQASQQFGQGLASQQLGAYRGGLQGIAGQGMGATNALANYRMGYGNQLGQGYTNLGDISASEALGRAGLHRNFVNMMNDTWGVGGGGQSGGGQGGYPSYGGGQSSYGNSMSGPGTSSYQFGSDWGSNPFGGSG